MASIKDLKKDINNVLGDIIEGVYVVEATNGKNNTKGCRTFDWNEIETLRSHGGACEGRL